MGAITPSPVGAGLPDSSGVSEPEGEGLPLEPELGVGLPLSPLPPSPQAAKLRAIINARSSARNRFVFFMSVSPFGFCFFRVSRAGTPLRVRWRYIKPA